jgi:hypothetical protein
MHAYLQSRSWFVIGMGIVAELAGVAYSVTYKSRSFADAAG